MDRYAIFDCATYRRRGRTVHAAKNTFFSLMLKDYLSKAASSWTTKRGEKATFFYTIRSFCNPYSFFTLRFLSIINYVCNIRYVFSISDDDDDIYVDERKKKRISTFPLSLVYSFCIRNFRDLLRMWHKTRILPALEYFFVAIHFRPLVTRITTAARNYFRRVWRLERANRARINLPGVKQTKEDKRPN